MTAGDAAGAGAGTPCRAGCNWKVVVRVGRSAGPTGAAVTPVVRLMALMPGLAGAACFKTIQTLVILQGLPDALLGLQWQPSELHVLGLGPW